MNLYFIKVEPAVMVQVVPSNKWLYSYIKHFGN